MIDAQEEKLRAVLHIKDFPPDLQAEIKIKAAIERISMRDFVIDVLQAAVDEKVRKTRARAS